MSTPELPYLPGYAAHGIDAKDRTILDHWRDGISTAITAKRLWMARSTISNRRAQIRKRYAVAQAHTYPTPEERARRTLDMDKIVTATAGMSWHKESA